MDITAVRHGIAANADTLSGLRCFAYMPSSITPPSFYVAEPEITFDRTFQRGMDEISIACRLLVSRASDEAGQDRLDAYLSGSGPRSMKVAVESDPTLGGACADSHLTRISGYGLWEHSGTQYYGAEFTMRVIGEG